MINSFKAADIKLHKDSQGAYEAKHKYQGILYESEFFDTKRDARIEAVYVLTCLKDDEEVKGE
jgi:hypothetical protein